MTENETNNKRLQDVNLREACRQEEEARPQMSADLNTRLMLRVREEKPHRNYLIWSWLVAACVAGVLFIIFTPPKKMEGETMEHQPQSIAQHQSSGQKEMIVQADSDTACNVVQEIERMIYKNAKHDMAQIEVKTIQSSQEMEGNEESDTSMTMMPLMTEDHMQQLMAERRLQQLMREFDPDKFQEEIRRNGEDFRNAVHQEIAAVQDIY